MKALALAAILAISPHPVNPQGFVTDGTPQVDDAHCVGTARQEAACLTARRYDDWQVQVDCLDNIVDREDPAWDPTQPNTSGSGAYGLPQALPGDKMAEAGDDWQTNPRTQLIWMEGYVVQRYGSPCEAWRFWQGHGFY